MDGMMSIVEWAKDKGISKQWAITLAGDGRLPGAMIVDNYRWMVPVGTESPTRKRSARLIEAERKRLEKARLREEKEQREAMVRMQIHEEESQNTVRLMIESAIRAGAVLSSDGSGTLPDGRTVAPIPDWTEEDYQYYLSRTGKVVEADSDVKGYWPRNEAEFDRKQDIREGVADGLTLDQIKAQVKHWGADEQVYYDSLVSGT